YIASIYIPIVFKDEHNADPVVVTLGNNGCIAKHGKEVVRVPAIGEVKAIDGMSLEECCKIGACIGGFVTQSFGGEVTLENWQWLYKQMQIRDLHI
ncbi:hypothetical protein HN873_055420, partial [Arachis hypogaea]